MIKVDVWYYSLDPYFYEGPGTLDRFDLEASTGEKRTFLQGTIEEEKRDVKEFINWVRGKHPDEEVVDCTGI